MIKRTLTALILIGSLVGVLVASYFVSPIFMDVLVLVYMAGAVYEMYHCFKEKGYKMFRLPLIFVLIAAYPSYYLAQHFLSAEGGLSVGLQALAGVFLIAVVIALGIFTFRPAKKADKVESAGENCSGENAAENHLTENCAVNNATADFAGSTAECKANCEATSDVAQGSESVLKSPLTLPDKSASINDLFANVFILLYPVAFLAMAWTLTYKYYAIFAVLFAVFLPVGGDTFAYWFGSMIGGKKLCPKISPKKTVAGAVGGLVGSMVVAILFWLVFEFYGLLNVAPSGQNYMQFIPHSIAGWQWKTALIYLSIGLIGGVLAQLGDLAASRIKRAIGVKDYGKIFPGHGGVMDRMDSIIYGVLLLVCAFLIIYGI